MRSPAARLRPSLTPLAALAALAALLLAPAALAEGDGWLAHAEWADWTFDASFAGRYESNVNGASRSSEEEWEITYLPTATVGRVLQLTDRTRLDLAAEVAGEIHQEWDDLHAVEGLGRLGLFHKFGLGRAPWARAWGEGGYRGVDDSRRSGPLFTVGLDVGKRFSPRLRARIGYRYDRRYGKDGPPAGGFPDDDVFDQEGHEVVLDGSFLVTERLELSLGFGYRRGDFESNARANRMSILMTKDIDAVAMDRVFGGWVYRVWGNGYTPSVNLNYGLADRWSIDAGYRFHYVDAGGLDYENHVAQLAVMFRW